MYKTSLSLASTLICLSYFFAGAFKVWHGAWNSPESMAYILENQLSAYQYFYPDGVRSQFANLIYEHKWIGHTMLVSAIILQLSFFVGLIFNSIPRVLAFFLLAFHLMDWFMMNLGVFMCMTVLSFTLWESYRLRNLSV